LKNIHCIKCEEDKPLSEFYANRIVRQIYICIPCYKIDRKQSLGSRYYDYKYSAKRRELSFRLSRERFAQLTSSPCNYCGEYNYPELKINGIDRVKSDKGYVAQNCVPSCFDCNRSKNVQPVDKFEAKAIKRAKHIMKRAA